MVIVYAAGLSMLGFGGCWVVNTLTHDPFLAGWIGVAILLTGIGAICLK